MGEQETSAPDVRAAHAIALSCTHTCFSTLASESAIFAIFASRDAGVSSTPSDRALVTGAADVSEARSARRTRKKAMWDAGSVIDVVADRV